jgi:DNA-binding NarL/FixJ family response regulator
VITVLVADDHPAFVAGLRHLLATFDGVDVVATAHDGNQAVVEAVRHRPDVAIMDLQMPQLSGIEATRLLRTRAPDTAVLVLTMLEDADSVFAAMRAGARGYLLKGAGLQEISAAVTAVARGEAIFGAAVAGRVLDFFSAPSRPVEPFPDLTAREREILEQLADGDDNAAIARRLSLTTKTVRNHVSNIFAKLQVADRTQAALRAREAGLGSGPRGVSPK